MKNRSNKSETIWYYNCSKKPLGCPARAIVRRLERFDEEEGRMVVENRLVAVSKAEVHDHSSQNSDIIAELIRIELKPEIIKNPELSISED